MLFTRDTSKNLFSKKTQKIIKILTIHTHTSIVRLISHKISGKRLLQIKDLTIRFKYLRTQLQTINK